MPALAALAVVIILRGCASVRVNSVNSVNNGGSVSFDLVNHGMASAALFNPRDGALVRSLFSGKRLAAGLHTVDLPPNASSRWR